MKVDPRFKLDVDELDGQLRIKVSAASDCVIAEGEAVLFNADFGVLAGMAGAPAEWVATIGDPGRKSFLVNGWQSWSFAGELDADEVVRPSYIKRFSMFSQGPARKAGRGELLSYFYVGIRAGEGRLFLVSRNSGGAPLVFRAERQGHALAVAALAEGARFKAGQGVAELRLFWREGLFPTKDAFRDVFRAERHFERLAFLGKDGRLVPGGYESWYNHYTDISEALIEADLVGLTEPGNLISEYYLKRGKPTVFQVDDGWQLRVGEWFTDLDKFPAGARVLRERIEEEGHVPGLWLAPFLVTKRCSVCRDHPEWILEDGDGKRTLAGWNPNWDGDFWCLDLSVPAVEEYLVETFERVIEVWGYRYLKLDFLYAAFLPGKRRGGGAAFEHFERIIGRITLKQADRSGLPVAWLGCGAPLESSWRHFPLMRIGADTREAWEYRVLKLAKHEGRPSAYANMLATIGRSILDGTVFVNDPDVVFCRERNNRLRDREKELVALVAFLLASQIMFSDGADELRTERVLAFTARLVTAFDRLGGREYGAWRIARDVFALESRDGAIRGIINLSDRAWKDASSHWSGDAVVEHARRDPSSAGGATIAFEPRSISIYEVAR